MARDFCPSRRKWSAGASFERTFREVPALDEPRALDDLRARQKNVL